MYIYIYTYIILFYICIYIYIYIHTRLVIMKHFYIQVLAELIKPTASVEAVFGKVASAIKAAKQLLKIVQPP